MQSSFCKCFGFPVLKIRFLNTLSYWSRPVVNCRRRLLVTLASRVRNYRPLVKYVTNNSGKHLSPDFSPANNILRPLTMKVESRRRMACSKPRIIERVWKQSQKMPAKAGVDIFWERARLQASHSSYPCILLGL